MPDARAGVDADANVAQDDCESSRNPCPEDQRRTPACEIQAPGAIRVCDLFDKPLAISFWFTRGGDCIPSQDAFDQVASRFAGRVNFLSINVRDDPETVAGIVRDRGWDVPVGIDRDGAVSNLYRVGVCPTIFLAYPGGILYEDEDPPGQLRRRRAERLVGGLLKATRERAERGALMEGGAGTGPGSDDEQLATRGRVDPALREEFPGLYLRYLEVGCGSGRSPKSLRRRLATLSDRFAGAQAITFRTKPIPGAYRVFYRHIGLDPDEQPTPAEAVVLERMLKGGFISRSRLDDALTIAMIESGVPVHALDADRLTGTLTIRPTSPVRFSRDGRGTCPPDARDRRRSPARSLLFGAVGSGRGASPATTRTMLLVVGVSGVPEIAVEEALWLASEVMLGD